MPCIGVAKITGRLLQGRILIFGGIQRDKGFGNKSVQRSVSQLL